MLSPPDKRGGAAASHAAPESLDGKYKTAGGQQEPRLLVPLGLWVFEFSDEVPQETESTRILKPASIIHKAK